MPDTRITDFLCDIAPFFKGQAITYVDVGAYVGLVFREVMQSAIVVKEAHLIEPNPDSYKQLQANIAAWNEAGTSISTYHIAAGEKKGILLMEKNRTMTRVVTEETTLHVNDQVNNSIGERFSIDSIKLDRLAKTSFELPINLMKMDVEGHEIAALRGTMKLLKHQLIDVLYIEAGLDPANTQQTHIHKLDNFLRNYGYRTYRIYEQKNEWPTHSPLLRRVNVAYMSESFANAHSTWEN